MVGAILFRKESERQKKKVQQEVEYEEEKIKWSVNASK
jgi:hypothetical protein